MNHTVQDTALYSCINVSCVRVSMMCVYVMCVWVCVAPEANKNYLHRRCIYQLNMSLYKTLAFDIMNVLHLSNI